MGDCFASYYRLSSVKDGHCWTAAVNTVALVREVSQLSVMIPPPRYLYKPFKLACTELGSL